MNTDLMERALTQMIQNNALERAELEQERNTSQLVLMGVVNEAESSQKSLKNLIANATSEKDKQN